MSNILCIYHGKCADGFTAAWAVHMALGENVDFHPGIYGQPAPDVTGRDVVMVDFSYKRDVLHEMASKARTLLILDHHKTAAEDLAGLPPPLDGEYNPNAMSDWQRECNSPNALHALFDMERSGAQIAWDYFHPGKTRPVLVDYVGDRDLWKFAMSWSREVNSYIFSFDYTFENWDKLDIKLTEDTKGAAAAGEAIERKHHKDVAELVDVTRRYMLIGGYNMPVANIPYTLTSDAGHLMAKAVSHGAAACYWDTPTARVFSLRSLPNGPDVSAIAASYGGGGHKNAAGFQRPLGWEGDSA